MRVSRPLLAATVLFALFIGTCLGAGMAKAAPQPYSLWVEEGTSVSVYLPTKVTPAGVYHYETPETNPTAAGLNNHPLGDLVWTGNGSENLPCEGGIHWIANKNVLTISNCLALPESTTSTTLPEETTTTEDTTTTTEPSSTTSSSLVETTTTVVSSTTSESPPAPTTTVAKRTELPYTGVPTWALILIGLTLIGGGTTLIRATHERTP